MRKYYSTWQYAKRNAKRAQKSLKRRLAFKRYKTRKNKSFAGITRRERSYRVRFNNKYAGYEKIRAPQDFSFIRNPEKIIDFITRLGLCYERRQRVFVILKDVEKIDYDAIVVLLSIMVKFSSSRIRFNGDFPKNKEAEKILKNSGFFDNLIRVFKEAEEYEITDNAIHTHANRKVDSELGRKILEAICPKIWGKKRVYKGFQRTILELMMNSHNHATVGVEGDKHWWLSVNSKRSEKRATFAFIDYGVGIFSSLENKKIGSKWFGWAQKLARYFKYGNNAEILRLILNGDLHQTVTGEYFRGKGLPGIKEALDRNLISKLHIITNNVYANVEEGIYKLLPQNFSGTFVYWELNEQNVHHSWNLS